MGQSPAGSTYSDVPSDYILVQGNADLENGWVKPRVWTTQITKQAYIGDLIMSVRAPAGAMGKTSYNAVIGRGVAAIKGNEFIYQLLVKMDKEGYWKKDSTGSTFESLNSESIKNAEIKLPSNEEQTVIGTYFEQLDHLITLHQRKCDGLKKLKKYMLQNMFPQNGEKTPKIRFQGFINAWEQRKLGELTIYRNGTGHEEKQSESGKYELINLNSISIDGGLKPSGKFIDEETETLLKDDLVMVLSDVGHGDLLGRVAIIPENNRFVLNQRVALLRNNSSVDIKYLFSYINAHQIYFKKQGAGSSQLNISRGSVENFEVLLPHKDEQKKIGKYLSSIDNLITLHQRKYNLCNKVKVYAWEQRKLGELTIYRNGTGHEEKQSESGKYELINLNSISIDGGLKPSGKFIDEETETLLKDDLVMVLSDVGHGDLLGRVAIIPENNRFVLNQRVALLRNNSSVDIKYLFSYINAHQIYFKKQGAGSSQLNISRGSVENFEVLLPHKDEQKKIGKYLSSIDNLITLHQRKKKYTKKPIILLKITF